MIWLCSLLLEDRIKPRLEKTLPVLSGLRLRWGCPALEPIQLDAPRDCRAVVDISMIADWKQCNRVTHTAILPYCSRGFSEFLQVNQVEKCKSSCGHCLFLNCC